MLCASWNVPQRDARRHRPRVLETGQPPSLCADLVRFVYLSGSVYGQLVQGPDCQ